MTSPTSRERWGIEGIALGISLGGVSDPAEWQRAIRWAERAEALGMHSLWLPEMHFARGASTTPLLALAAFAARTRTVRLGTTSLLLPIHPPLQLARDVALLDALSSGRVLLGLGRGFRAPLFSAYGIDPATKRDRFDDALDLMLASWRGERVSQVGTVFEDIDAAGDEPPLRPIQTPHPPLAVAAFGHMGLRQAARRALPYLASPIESLDLLVENHTYHREQLPEGADPDDIVVPIMRTIHVASDDLEAARVTGALEAETRAIPGRVPKALARAAEAGIEDRAVVGTTSQVLDRLAHYRERLPFDLLIARPQVPGASDSQRESSLERLASDVMPKLR